jgi:thiamine biosynthesis lipoprotein
MRPSTRGAAGGALSRRGALKVLAAAVALPAAVMALRQGIGGLQPVRWDGEALGAEASLTLWHRDAGFARRTLARVESEVARLEGIFSLYRPDSEISRLNRDGSLAAPAADLVGVLEEARRIAEASGGAFDPTVQPLWDAYAAYFAGHAGGAGPDRAALDAARALTDYAAIDAGPRRIRLARPGMAITLNGIAQGYITDRVTELLRTEGFDHAMVELGETRALGAAPDGKPFEVALMSPTVPGLVDRAIPLADAALSVSGGYGMRFAGSEAHHIFDPATGLSANRLRDAVVVAPRAVWADALSTAIFVAGEDRARAILRSYPGARATMTRGDGSAAVA